MLAVALAAGLYVDAGRAGVVAFICAIAGAVGLAAWRAIVRVVSVARRRAEEKRARLKAVADAIITKRVVEEIRAELQANGGSSAFDLLTNAIGGVREEIVEFSRRLDALEQRQNGDDASRVAVGLLPPPPPPYVG